MSAVIAVHIVAASLSVILGSAVLLMEKGSVRHRLLGRIWGLGMLVAALSSFWIRALTPGYFSWVHGLSLLTLAGLVRAIWAIRHGNVRGHQVTVSGLFVGLVLAGVAALVTPHRLLNVVLTGWMT
ncbi:MAG TPA: DUF2306 domain-containing protein [Paraburkholderia sp.]|nr:DUF2306 domain-containing protein [Paraburkholderia sp.]